MRTSDALASNWTYIWGLNFLALKFLELNFSNVALVLISAIFSFILIFGALLIEVAALFVLHNSNATLVSFKLCYGGICWQSFPSCPVRCDRCLNEFMWSMLHNFLPRKMPSVFWWSCYSTIAKKWVDLT